MSLREAALAARSGDQMKQPGAVHWAVHWQPGKRARKAAADLGHWTPDEMHGWFWVQVQAPLRGAEAGPCVPFSVLLWWNEDSIDGGWWIGQAPRSVALGALLPGVQVLGPSNEKLPKRQR